jgi:hypothetical protein
MTHPQGELILLSYILVVVVIEGHSRPAHSTITVSRVSAVERDRLALLSLHSPIHQGPLISLKDSSGASKNGKTPIIVRMRRSGSYGQLRLAGSVDQDVINVRSSADHVVFIGKELEFNHDLAS